MNIQMGFLSDEKSINEQRKYLQLLIELKSKEVEEQELQIFWGTPEQISEKKMEINKKINNFINKLSKAFPGIL